MKRSGYVYLFGAGGYHKIGKSVDYHLRAVQLSLPFPLQVLHAVLVDDMSAAETLLHRRYAHRKVRGEWFVLTEKEVRAFCSLTSEDFANVARNDKNKRNAQRKAGIIVRFRELLMNKELQEHRHISIREVSRNTGINAYTVSGLADNTIEHLPGHALDAMCKYFKCKVDDLLCLE